MKHPIQGSSGVGLRQIYGGKIRKNPVLWVLNFRLRVRRTYHEPFDKETRKTPRQFFLMSTVNNFLVLRLKYILVVLSIVLVRLPQSVSSSL